LKIKKELGAKGRKRRVRKKESARERIQGKRTQVLAFNSKNQNHRNDNFVYYDMCYSIWQIVRKRIKKETKKPDNQSDDLSSGSV
jgi:hypothetical protein